MSFVYFSEIIEHTTTNQNPLIIPESPGNVLKKVASFTVVTNDRAPAQTDISTNKILRPTYVPEKLKISAYEKFEGQFGFYL